jgi:DNA-directed RNA polymerase subunit beta'
MLKDGQQVKKGDVICTWDPFNNVIMAEINGILKFENVLKGSLIVKNQMNKPVTVKK